jgi:hypothetical protein
MYRFEPYKVLEKVIQQRLINSHGTSITRSSFTDDKDIDNGRYNSEKDSEIGPE